MGGQSSNCFEVSLCFAVFDSNCLKSHYALLQLIVIVLNVVSAKTNWRETNIEYEFENTSLLPNQKYKFKILLV